MVFSSVLSDASNSDVLFLFLGTTMIDMVLMEVLFAHNQIYYVDLYMFNRTYLIGLAELVIS